LIMNYPKRIYYNAKKEVPAHIGELKKRETFLARPQTFGPVG